MMEHNIRPISFLISDDDIRRYRAALMGVAIIWIIFFHANLGLPILNKGDMGVDIFFFLSAIGLCYSYEKNSDIIVFYKKRVLRIIPTWWPAIAAASFVSSVFLSLPHPRDIGEFLLFFSGVGYWLQGVLHASVRVVYFEWYIPTLLLFYTLFPLLVKRRSLLLFAILGMWEIVVWYSTTAAGAELPQEIRDLSVPRVSIFIYGLLYYRFLISPCSSRLSCLLSGGLMAASLLLYYSGYGSVHHYVLLLMPIGLKLLCFFIQISRTGKVLAFLGGISLELYLVHIYWNFPEFNLGPITVPRYVSIFPKIALCIAFAMLLRAGVRKMQSVAGRIIPHA